MGILESLASQLTAGKEELAGAPKKLVEGTLEMFHEHQGGFKALTDKLSTSGLAEQVKSWVGTGPNLPVTADQIKKSLGPEELEKLALKTKLSVEEVTSHLAAALPQIVDKLTPDGKLPTAGLQEHAQQLLGKLGFGKKS